jgi:hypothetical protein
MMVVWGQQYTYVLILMQHVVPELGLAEVIVATGKPANPIRLQPVMAKCIHLHIPTYYIY